MSHAQRGRLVVVLGDGWRQFSRPLANADMLGTVEVAGEAGALIRRHVDGIFCRSIHGRMLTLNSFKVNAAIAAAEAGRG